MCWVNGCYHDQLMVEWATLLLLLCLMNFHLQEVRWKRSFCRSCSRSISGANSDSQLTMNCHVIMAFLVNFRRSGRPLDVLVCYMCWLNMQKFFNHGGWACLLPFTDNDEEIAAFLRESCRVFQLDVGMCMSIYRWKKYEKII